MAAVNITINGVICDLYGRTITGPVKIVGEAMYSDLGVGGGPVIPPAGGGQPPLGIWGPTDPRPSNPIANVPGLPPMPDQPPTDGTTPGGDKPPPEGEGGWGFYDGRWGYFPGPGQAQPK